jgi:hypothetical protein
MTGVSVIRSFCTGCGAGLGDRVHFCPSCGRSVYVLGQGLVEATPATPSPTARPSAAHLLPAVVIVAAMVVVAALVVVLRVSLRPTESEAATAARAASASERERTLAPSATPSSSPRPSTSPFRTSSEEVLATASRVEALLDESASARAAVIAATSGLSSCRLPAAEAASSLQAVAETRSRLLNDLAMIRFDPLPHGSRLAALLGQAWSASLAADEAYLRWAESRSYDGGCDTTDADYAAGNAASAQAVAAKRAFVALWNSEVAAPLHVARRDDGHL